ncbi:ribose-phosphate pyrophosphokinase [Pseudoduganella ginsengisoli]|uniref:ribose-phosphate diphosphokinase n=1 Tax=Pseudoduganella ginsengisoli TaxID=1462440 RepID=A0A6L6PXR0_9BURK|nr:ribose-phosphate diphosphokinase [Pseudoduganella ginsengisoli]MTW01728.1 ribose-phosphate diphosphokinase [Pseudoduganella ginsengisoli]
MKPLLFALPDAQGWVEGLAAAWDGETAELDMHYFPDGECCPRFGANVQGRAVVLAASLAASGADTPGSRLFALYLAASVARELGAASVGLVLPYLPYMRQDARFAPGQGITALHVGRLLSGCADWLATVDPHLHRYSSLSQPYSLAAVTAASAPAIARWVAANVARPVIVGPDQESAQWVEHVAQLAHCPSVVLRKQRHGDRSVTVAPEQPGWGAMDGCTPVLVDDIASSGHTLAEAVGALRAAGFAPPVCVVVHALFAGDALDVLRAAGPSIIASCNTAPHATNRIDVIPALAEAARDLWKQGGIV